MDAQLAAELEWLALTTTINNVDTSEDFMTQLLYGEGMTIPTETIEVGSWHGDRMLPPMVKKGGKAVPMKGRTQGFMPVAAPNIRLSYSAKPSDVMFQRTPGVGAFFVPSGDSQVRNAVAEHIRGDVEYIRGFHTNALEYMACQSLDGIINYEDEEHDAWVLDFNKPASHNITLSGTDLWSDAASNPLAQRVTADRLKSRGKGNVGQTTHVICGADAADALTGNENWKTDLDRANVDAGTLSLIAQYSESGVRFLGRTGATSWWEYSRQMVDPSGTIDLIDPKKAHFISNTSAARFQLYWAAIPEMTEDEFGPFITRIFSKARGSWDPPAVEFITHSRPLPVPHKPQAVVSFQVLA